MVYVLCFSIAWLTLGFYGGHIMDSAVRLLRAAQAREMRIHRDRVPHPIFRAWMWWLSFLTRPITYPTLGLVVALQTRLDAQRVREFVTALASHSADIVAMSDHDLVRAQRTKIIIYKWLTIASINAGGSYGRQ